MQDLMNQRMGFVLAVANAKEYARVTRQNQMVYVYNTDDDWKGHHIVIEKSVDDCFSDDDKLDFVKEVVPE